MKEELIKFLQEKQIPGDWLHIANTFQVLGTNKRKSDIVRKLWNKYHPKTSEVPDTKWEVYPTESANFVQVVGSGVTTDYVITTTASYTKPEKKVKKKDLPYLSGNKDNVLVIGDLHEPFCKKGYRKFCREQQERFNCGTVVFIGDIIDNHAQSFHNSDADGLSAKQELELAAQKLEKWYKTFPEAIVTLGNHDRIVARKLFSVGISQRWLKPLGDVLNTPNWKFVEQHKHNGVLYIHGEAGTALKKAQQEMCSVVQGHSHTSGYVQLFNGGRNFGMQVGCGIDFDSYAFAYAQRGNKPILSCGVVLNQSPIVIPFIHD